jgi:hypothetical protein
MIWFVEFSLRRFTLDGMTEESVEVAIWLVTVISVGCPIGIVGGNATGGPTDGAAIETTRENSKPKTRTPSANRTKRPLLRFILIL